LAFDAETGEGPAAEFAVFALGFCENFQLCVLVSPESYTACINT